MPDDHHIRTQTLIRDIERKDRRFRVAQSIFTILILLVLVGVITAQYRTLAGVRNQLQQQKEIAAMADKQNQERQETMLRRLDCMTVFFSQKDRTNLSIKDIDKCTLDRGGEIQKFFTQEPGQAPQTTKEQQPLPKVPSTPPKKGESAKPPVKLHPRTLPPSHQSIEILDMPICVLLTKLCIW